MCFSAPPVKPCAETLLIRLSERGLPIARVRKVSQASKGALSSTQVSPGIAPQLRLFAQHEALDLAAWRLWQFAHKRNLARIGVAAKAAADMEAEFL